MDTASQVASGCARDKSVSGASPFRLNAHLPCLKHRYAEQRRMEPEHAAPAECRQHETDRIPIGDGTPVTRTT